MFWAKTTASGIAIVGVLSACSTTMTVVSNPKEADVFVLGISDSRRTLIGKTPIELPPLQKGQDYYYLEIIKPGYMPSVAIIPFISSLSANVEVKMTMKKQDSEWFKMAMRGVFINDTDAIVREFLQFQEKMIQGNDAECVRLINVMGRVYGNIAAYHSLVGAYYWQKNNLEEARNSFERLLALNPKDAEAKRMLSVLNVMMGS